MEVLPIFREKKMASKIADDDLDGSDDKSDKMSSVSKCSNFSLKSQQYIAKQDCQMAAMRSSLVCADLCLNFHFSYTRAC